MKRALGWILATLVFVAALGVRAPELLSRARRNAGALMVVRALTDESEATAAKAVDRAQALFGGMPSSPENRAVWRGLGFALAAQGQESEAVAAWQAAGGMEEELIERGKTAARTGGHYGEQLRWYERALRMAPDNELAWIQVGRICSLSEGATATEICDLFFARNSHNWFVDPGFALVSPGVWRFTYREEVLHDVASCPGMPGVTCAHIVVGDTTLESGSSWYQRIRLQPDTRYRFSAWIKVHVGENGRWRPLYYQGSEAGTLRGYWPGYQSASTDWKYWESVFAAPAFDNGVASFHPVRLHSEGQAWFHDPCLVILDE